MPDNDNIPAGTRVGVTVDSKPHTEIVNGRHSNMDKNIVVIFTVKVDNNGDTKEAYNKEMQVIAGVAPPVTTTLPAPPKVFLELKVPKKREGLTTDPPYPKRLAITNNSATNLYLDGSGLPNDGSEPPGGPGPAAAQHQRVTTRGTNNLQLGGHAVSGTNVGGREQPLDNALRRYNASNPHTQHAIAPLFGNAAQQWDDGTDSTPFGNFDMAPGVAPVINPCAYG